MLVIRVCLFSASSSVSTNVRFVASPLFVRLSKREGPMTMVVDASEGLILLKPYGYFGSFDVSTIV